MIPLKYKLNKISHYLFSNSRHGTHSPFVYKLVDEVIYQAPRKEEKELWSGLLKNELDIEVKKKLLLVRLFQNFPFGSFQIISNQKELFLEETMCYYKNNWSDRRIFYVDDLSQVDAILEKRGEKDLIIVNEIYRDGNQQMKWNLIQSNNSIIASIDLFHYGLLFFRKEQQKENFKIRFNL